RRAAARGPCGPSPGSPRKLPTGRSRWAGGRPRPGRPPRPADAARRRSSGSGPRALVIYLSTSLALSTRPPVSARGPSPMAVTATTPVELVEQVYARLPDRVALGRERLGRPLTFAEKVLVNHLRDPYGQPLERGRSYADFLPDRVAMQ